MRDAPQEWTSLFDDAGNTKEWLPHRAKLANVATRTALHTLGGKYRRLADRMAECGNYLEFCCYRIKDGAEVMRRLVRCSWCRVRLCFLCEKAKSRKRFLQTAEVTAGWFKLRPRDQTLLVTLTIESVGGGQLAATVNFIMEAFRRLSRSTQFKRLARGWLRTIEVTRNTETGLWHVHIHILIFVPPEYFKRNHNLYLTQKDWQALWKKCARLNYDPIVDVRAVKGVGGGPLGDEGKKSLREVTKYCVKPSAVVQFDDAGQPLAVDPQVLKTLYDALHRRRLFAMSGSLRKIARELGHVDVEDPNADLYTAELIPEGAVYLGREIYQWDVRSKQYLRIPRTVGFSSKQEGPHDTEPIGA